MTVRRREAGSVTAELAVGMVAVAMVLVVVLAVAAATVAQVRCVDAARSAARAAALGEDDASVRDTAARVAGSGATVTTTRADGWITVTVSTPLVAQGPFTGLRATGSATGRTEP
ncbi:MAG: pilus assembly protein TadE [Micrococcales bacterium]|nr:pilus assembly protein TadE [Micrococcales bacterium]